RAVTADRPAHGAIFPVDPARLLEQPFQGRGAVAMGLDGRGVHPVQRPEEVHGRRATGAQVVRRGAEGAADGRPGVPAFRTGPRPAERAPSTAPYAAATPIAGAPRTRNDRIASQTAGSSRQSSSTYSVGSRVWSISRTKPLLASPTQPTVPIGSFVIVVVIVLVFVVLVLLGIDPGIELGKDVPDVSHGALQVARLERTVRTGVAGDLGRQAEQVEVLSPHLQEDLALRVELEGFLERLLH